MDKIKIITTIASWPDAIKLHKLSFSKYLKEPFELIAVIDTPSEPGPYNLWNSSLRKYGIELANQYCDKVIIVPEEIHNNRRSLFPKTTEPAGNNANLRASDSLQIAFNSELLNSNSKVIIIDNDMFPIVNFSWESIMNHLMCRSVIHSSSRRFSRRKIEYLWSGLMFIDGSKVPFKNEWSFDCGKINKIKVDVSGQTHYWLRKIRTEKLDSLFEPINHYSSLNWSRKNKIDLYSKYLRDFIENDERNLNGKFYSELYDNRFIHFRAASNWRREPADVVLKRIDNFTKSFLLHLE
jgi:hypothetical protein